MQAIKDYIRENYDSSADFARAFKVSPQLVTHWVNSGCMVHNHKVVKPLDAETHIAVGKVVCKVYASKPTAKKG